MDNKQVDVTIQQKGTIITEHLQIKDFVREFCDKNSGYRLSQLSQVDQKIISKLLNNEEYNPSIETVIKIMSAIGKKIVIV